METEQRKLSLLRNLYYDIKPIIPRKLQLALRRRSVRKSRELHKCNWPIMLESSTPPKNWQGWPGGKKFALVITHDVDTAKGEDRCLDLMKVDFDLGFRSAFFFVAARVRRSADIFPSLRENGFEIGVHGLFHDGRLFRSFEIFRHRAIIINRFLTQWNAVGFRAPAVHHVLEWMHELDILYDASTFDIDPFEPQPDGVGTIFPFRVENSSKKGYFIELPYTLPQDFTLYVLMREKSTAIWKQKIDWIARQGGMALFITHPDYMNFESGRAKQEEYPSEMYSEFLSYIQDVYAGQYWNALPSEVASFWCQRY